MADLGTKSRLVNMLREAPLSKNSSELERAFLMFVCLVGGTISPTTMERYPPGNYPDNREWPPREAWEFSYFSNHPDFLQDRIKSTTSREVEKTSCEH